MTLLRPRSPALPCQEPGVSNNIQCDPGKWLPAEPKVRKKRWTKSEEKAYTLVALPHRRRFVLFFLSTVYVVQMSLTGVWIVSRVFGLFMCGSQQLASRGINIWSSLGRYYQPANAAGHWRRPSLKKLTFWSSRDCKPLWYILNTQLVPTIESKMALDK